MTVDTLINWFATIGDFPVLAFILAVIISGIPLFLIMALNAMVAFMVAISLDIKPNCIIKSLKSFPGIMRRFSIELYEPKIFIDDYAHHPNEINSVYNSLKILYPNKKKLVIF